jgi:DNA-binding transcriptional LysR family regulator
MAIADLRQGVKEIEFLSDPAAGELRIGCPDSVVNGPLVPIIECLGRRYPRVRLHVEQFATPMFEFPELEQRKVDLVVARLNPTHTDHSSHIVNVEPLFDERFCVVVGRHSPFARRAKIKLADLVNERWIMTPAETPGARAVETVFRDAGLDPPRSIISSFSTFLRCAMVASGQYVSAVPASVLRLNTDKLCEVPIALPMPRWPVAVVTLKNHALNPAALLFIECAREIAASASSRSASRVKKQTQPRSA